MKKLFILMSISLILLSCGSSSNSKKGTKKQIEKSVVQTDTMPEILLGRQNRELLSKEPNAKWFMNNFENYTFDTMTVAKLKPYLKDINIQAFMGTWCSDSQREVPAFYKILDAANFNYQNLELVTVSREKNTPQGLENGLNIQQVPTFIFYKNRKEIGRYVEFARETLEKDILAILSGAPYKHSYED